MFLKISDIFSWEKLRGVQMLSSYGYEYAIKVHSKGFVVFQYFRSQLFCCQFNAFNLGTFSYLGQFW